MLHWPSLQVISNLSVPLQPSKPCVLCSMPSQLSTERICLFTRSAQPNLFSTCGKVQSAPTLLVHTSWCFSTPLHKQRCPREPCPSSAAVSVMSLEQSSAPSLLSYCVPGSLKLPPVGRVEKAKSFRVLHAVHWHFHEAKSPYTPRILV